MAPRTSQWLQERVSDTPTKGLAWQEEEEKKKVQTAGIAGVYKYCSAHTSMVERVRGVRHTLNFRQVDSESTYAFSVNFNAQST